MSAARRPRELPPVWFALAMGAIALLHSYWPVARLLDRPWSLAGFVIQGVAMFYMGQALWLFRRARTGIRPFQPATALVERGPFRRTRNPMYLGFVVVAFGLAVCLGTLSGFAVPPLLWWWLDRRFVRREEAFLRERFGADYDAYCARVPRWW